MVISGICEVNEIKSGESISNLPGIYIVGNFLKGSTLNFDGKISDTFRISYGFRCCHMRRYIAESTTLGQIIGSDHITTFLEASFLPISCCNL